ncbi:RpiB/LacA/LacB family sugar-phosphate isomerase [Enterocloster sp.]|uniref:RpiB/LacA/LacB family sugar-phosphate isomerase n=1 Tax=Enterocloster sp. TaxID=2719315 RepID=UPI0039A0D78F
MTRCVVIGCDNAAVPMKDILRSIEEMGIAVEDMGVSSEGSAALCPDRQGCMIESLTAVMRNGEADLVVRNWHGMTANKFKGIRAHDIFSAQRSVLSNNGNVICFGHVSLGRNRKDDFKASTVDYIDGPSTPKIKHHEFETANFR